MGAADRALAVSLGTCRHFDAHESPPVSTLDVTDFAHSIFAVALPIYAKRSVEETLQTIAEVIHSSVPGFDQVGISTLHKNGEVITRAFKGDLVLRLDEFQYGLGEGPCVDALNGIDIVAAPGLRDERRWGQYVPRAVSLGVRSQLALRLHHGDNTIGSVNLYSTVSDQVTQNAQALASAFATHSAVALDHAEERATLIEALQSRKVIGEAIGILMERYDVNEDRAFAFLVRASSHTNIKLRSVAQELVDERNGRVATP